jgi:CubicO group peptidase (beta-lactamase class C family)
MCRSKSVVQILSVSIQAALLLLLFGLAGCGSDSDSDSTDSSLSGQLQKLVQEHGIPGAVGIVVSHSSVIDVQAAGVRRSGTPDPVTTNDLFYIGSIGKSMTATMIARLVDGGVLSWDSKPADVIPGLSGSIHPRYSGITLLDLLRHRAGLPADEDYDLTDEPEFTGSLPQQRTQASIWVLSRPPTVSPGTFHYSNGGYTVAAAMAESATGVGWRDLMDSWLFEPLGINAYYGWPTDYDPQQQPSGHDSNYQPVDSSILPDEIRLMEPAGDISMSIFDLAKFMQLHMDGHQRRPRLLTQSAFDVLHTTVPVDEESYAYACGFAIYFQSFGTLLTHNGSNDYFFSEMYIIPEKDLAVAIVVNARGDLTGWQTALAAETVLENFLPYTPPN